MSEILLADDDSSFREMIAATLRAAGFAVRAVTAAARRWWRCGAARPTCSSWTTAWGSRTASRCAAKSSRPAPQLPPVLILTGEAPGEPAGGVRRRGRRLPGQALRPARAGGPGAGAAAAVAAVAGAHPTTGLPGGEAIHGEILRCRDRGKPFSVCYLDLDNFKPFSDRFGFAVADMAIQEAGHILHDVEEPGRVRGPRRRPRLRSRSRPRAHRGARPPGAGHLRRAAGAISLPRPRRPFRKVRRGGPRGKDPGVRAPAPSRRHPPRGPARWVSLDHLGERVAELKGRVKRAGSTGIEEAAFPLDPGALAQATGGGSCGPARAPAPGTRTRSPPPPSPPSSPAGRPPASSAPFRRAAAATPAPPPSPSPSAAPPLRRQRQHRHLQVGEQGRAARLALLARDALQRRPAPAAASPKSAGPMANSPTATIIRIAASTNRAMEKPLATSRAPRGRRRAGARAQPREVLLVAPVLAAARADGVVVEGEEETRLNTSQLIIPSATSPAMCEPLGEYDTPSPT